MSKLKTPEFKVGQEVWSIENGFDVIGQITHNQICLKDSDNYEPDGKYQEFHTYRSLFTLDEAKELFGVVKEKKKKTVVMYQAVFKYIKNGWLFISVELHESEDAARKWGSAFEHIFVKLLTDRPIEVEVEE